MKSPAPKLKGKECAVGHCITGLVAKFELLATAVRLPVVVAPLDQDYGLAVPPDWRLCVEEEPETPTDEMARLGAELGKSFCVALVATDYSGGLGAQGAAVWTPSEHLEYEIFEGVINAALRAIGVFRSPEHDEFDCVGLSWYRSNDDWIKFAQHGKAEWQSEAWPDAGTAWKRRHQAS